MYFKRFRFITQDMHSRQSLLTFTSDLFFSTRLLVVEALVVAPLHFLHRQVLISENSVGSSLIIFYHTQFLQEQL
jgi:hypothetical protein